MLIKRKYIRSVYLLSADLEMLKSLVISSLRIFGCITRRLCIFLCNYVSLLSVQIQFLWFMNLMNNGQMVRSNENAIQYLPWWLREAMKKSQSGWFGPGFELGTSQTRVQSVTTAPPHWVAQFLFRRIDMYYYHHVKDFTAIVL